MLGGVADSAREARDLYAGYCTGCFLALVPGAALFGALFTFQDLQEWLVVAGGALAGGTLFVLVAAVCGYIPVRMFASGPEMTVGQRLVRISAVAIAVGAALAVILGIVTRQPVLSLWMVLSAVVWCALPGIALARLLSRSATGCYAATACVGGLAVIGACAAMWA